MHGLFNLEKRENDVFKEDTVLKSQNYLVKKNTDSDHAFAWIYSTVDMYNLPRDPDPYYFNSIQIRSRSKAWIRKTLSDSDAYLTSEL